MRFSLVFGAWVVRLVASHHNKFHFLSGIHNVMVVIQTIFSLQTVAELLHCAPDIACFGKLMTGGIIPLSATLATKSVFESFIGDSKVIL